MQLEGREGSRNIEDRRGSRGGGRRIGLPVGGVGGIVLVLLLSFVTGRNPLQLLSELGGLDGGGASIGPASEPDAGGAPVNDAASVFIARVLRSTEDAWGQVFAQSRQQYEPPVLVLFSEQTSSACGLGESAMGPFYCPGDRKVYLDTSFFGELDQRFGAPGDFAQAYVVAHEVGHHIQTLTGVSDKVGNARRQVDKTTGNQLSVRQELQADCFAGIWGAYAAREGLLDPGDVEEGLKAAAAIGDDTLQRQSQGRVVPESFTHGSSAQRVEWFRRGLEQGRIDACDTFAP
jgi:predicted metalloprotease